MNRIYIALIYVLVSCTFCTETESALTEAQLRDYLRNTYEKQASEMCTRINVAEWNFDTDVANQKKEEILLNVTLEVAAFEKEQWQKYFHDLDPRNYIDPVLKREVNILRILGDAALDEKRLGQLTTTVSTMTNIYSTAKVCPYKNQQCNLDKEGLSLEPGIEDVMSHSTDYDELAYIWNAWRAASGAQMRNLYNGYVQLSNEAARANNFSDYGAMWRDSYEDPNFIQNIDDLWTQVEPLYAELHKYASRKLKKLYGSKLDISDGLLPAHILGNMWAQDWADIAAYLKPYPNASKIDVDAALLKQNYTVLKMFQTADEFYQSMGLKPNGICYDVSKGAMIEKPTDGREVLCHASAWDFCDGQNYRIKMCTKIKFEDFIVIHHEMGHIQYFMQYAPQPYNFRSGANPGFHEAIGDTIALSVSNPTHLKKIKLLENYQESNEASINALMDMALQKIAFLPFGLLIDKWRWDVFSGSVKPEQWNAHWWEYRQKYQKVKPPVPRHNLIDFDPGAKYHVAGNSQYIAYFVAHILQFQFYKSLCVAAGQYDPANKEKSPLHECDYYQSKAAGDKLKAGLVLGSAKHWSDTLEIMTGERKLNAQAILEYFDPLYQYLKIENAKPFVE